MINVANVSLQRSRVERLRKMYFVDTGKEFPGNDWFIYGLIQQVGRHECEAKEDQIILICMASLSYIIGGGCRV